MSIKAVSFVFVISFLCFAFAIGSEFDADESEKNEGRLMFGFSELINCRPFNRTFVQTGAPCIRPNMTALNCRNQWCVCRSLSLPGGFPFSMWSCGTSSSTTPTPTTSSTSTTSSTTTSSATPTEDSDFGWFI